ncbi:hypothetical protein A9B99_02475 [Mangrovibacter phragmitis]|uniref:DUF805 domain-containing protein n=1 Tax=Mangrovibacter phragmitis TaxID=1691903 RepID=A0A1B7L8N6_9ENTR|nr:DUF805 domain-containing protein [Mangrovibacter phragmitis]OAT78610.1 hypothetical protein A9B99_02475 [Mangrovibacter phragmitis]
MGKLLRNYIICLKKYFTFKGRAPRAEFVTFTLANLVLESVLKLYSPDYYILLDIFLFIPGLTVSVRRLHDLNQSGLLILGPIGFAFVGFIALLFSYSSATSIPGTVMLLLSVVFTLGLFIWSLFYRGTKGNNQYGEDPLQC